MKIIAVIQARMGSTRLPGKVLKPLGDTDVLSHVVSRCRKIENVTEVVVATSTLSEDNAIANWCEENNVLYYRGSELDVLDRFIQCAKLYNPNYVIRVTADCPFVDYEMASEMVTLMINKQVDIIDIQEEIPRGLAVEIISYDALCRIHDSTDLQNYHREHVTYYAYEFREKFKRVNFIPPTNRIYSKSQLRITLDTDEDYLLCLEIAKHFKDKYIPCADIINYLANNPEIAKINSFVKQKDVK